MRKINGTAGIEAVVPEMVNVGFAAPSIVSPSWPVITISVGGVDSVRRFWPLVAFGAFALAGFVPLITFTTFASWVVFDPDFAFATFVMMHLLEGDRPRNPLGNDSVVNQGAAGVVASTFCGSSTTRRKEAVAR